MNTRHGLEIRAATSADAPGLSELFRLAGHDVPPRVLAGQLDLIRLEPGAVLIAATWGPPSGVIVVNWHWTLTAARRMARITLLLVDPDQRRRGIGRLLLKAAAHSARVAGCDALEAIGSGETPASHQFYRATGFAEAGPSFARALRKKGPGAEGS